MAISQMANSLTNVNSSTVKVLYVTIPNPVADVQCGVSQTTDSTGAITFTTKPCRSYVIQYYSGTQIYVNWGTAATATASSWLLSKTIPFPCSADDLANLHFIGTAGDIVQIAYRN